jgi:hypothetical protein
MFSTLHSSPMTSHATRNFRGAEAVVRIQDCLEQPLAISTLGYEGKWAARVGGGKI